MRYIYLLIILTCLNCSKERILHLPEIEHAEITEVLDVSPAYIFYDETQTDSTLLNRKNLIISTNWLVNVDRRLTLNQAIPKIKLMQDKKRNAGMHKNEDAKNYYTCNATNIKNLGFIEFTDIYYEFENPEKKLIDLIELLPSTSKENEEDKAEETNDNLSEEDISEDKLSQNTAKEPSVEFTPLKVRIHAENQDKFKKKTVTYRDLLKLHTPSSKDEKIHGFKVNFYFDKGLSFQDYISIKTKLLKIKSDKIKIDSTEYIY